MTLELSSQAKSIILRQFPIIIGHGINGDVVSLNDSSIGHYQCMIDKNDNYFTVWDLGTQSGTIINGQRISKTTPLLHGDEITIGSSSFRVLIGET
jgi:pSer/pThr/pTyr-binding forkhead associated (FHA) protein